MNKENFAIAFSEKEQEEAAKEVSLKIKLVFPKKINHLFIFFTSHYRPLSILKTVDFTLKPKTIYGMQAPFLIFEDRIISKGIVACCINKEGVELKEYFLKSGETQKMESSLNTYFRQLNRKDFYLLSFISAHINPCSFLNGTRLSLGKFFDFLGAGFIRKYSSHNSQIINNCAREGLLNIAVKGLKIHSLKLEGWVPLGKPFTITKTAASRDVIIEINSEPAINVYRDYLEEKFETFMKNRLFSFYPLGIKTAGGIRLINIIDCLEDGSLACVGEVREKDLGHIMFFNPDTLMENLENDLAPLKSENESMAIIVNSLIRKKAQREACEKEIKAVKKALGNKTKIIGLYSDYAFSSDKERGDLGIETGNLLLNLWQ